MTLAQIPANAALFIDANIFIVENNRGGRIRTADLLVPSQAR